MRKKITIWLSWIIILIVVALALSVISLCVGSVNIPFSQVFSSLFKGKGTIEGSIIADIRLPRILLSFAIGSALALSGVILQGLFRNPLVEPYTLGISGGAAMGVCLNIVLRLHQRLGILSLPLFGFAGAIFIIIFIYSLSKKNGVLKIKELLLIGVMISFISSSLIMFAMAVSRSEDLRGIIFWIMGSLEEPNWLLIKLAVLLSFAGLAVSYLLCFDLNALSLGEEEAAHLGINIEKSKRLLFLIASLLTGFSVSVAGIIGFVGLVIPHFVRLIIGKDHRILLIASFLSGGSFLVFSDTLARTIISPLELPVGVITGLIGGSLFLYTLSKKGYSL